MDSEKKFYQLEIKFHEIFCYCRSLSSNNSGELNGSCSIIALWLGLGAINRIEEVLSLKNIKFHI